MLKWTRADYLFGFQSFEMVWEARGLIEQQLGFKFIKLGSKGPLTFYTGID